MRASGRLGVATAIGRRGQKGAAGRFAAALGGLLALVIVVASMGAAGTPLAEGACGAGEASGGVRGVPKEYVTFYLEASEHYKLGERGPAILAGIHDVETDFGRLVADGVESGENFAGAGGPMQFLQATWDAYGVDGNGDGEADRYEPADAIFGAANYLRKSGAPGDWYRAIFAYNHADWYVDKVLDAAKRYGDVGSVADATCEAPTGAANLRESVRLYEPREFKALPKRLMAPGYAAQEVDARIWPGAVWILETYGLRVTAARESGHATHGDGTALDMVPAGDLGSQAAWDRSALRLAEDLGWSRGCGRSGTRPACDLVPAIQFVGYEGYPSHGSPATCGGGCPAHIHVSWVSSSFGSGPLSAPAAWVLVFPAPGGFS